MLAYICRGLDSKLKEREKERKREREEERKNRRREIGEREEVRKRGRKEERKHELMFGEKAVLGSALKQLKELKELKVGRFTSREKKMHCNAM